MVDICSHYSAITKHLHDSHVLWSHSDPIHVPKIQCIFVCPYHLLLFTSH